MSKKLLLADDSVTIQRVIELTFSGEDVQVLAVGDGEEAILRITSDKPDIVLADIGMPKRSGYEVCAFVKGKPELAHIPVLLLAGAFEPVDDAKAREVQCDGVLVKPFEPQHVIARVRELVGGAKGSPTQSAVPDIPRPAAVLAPSRPVELPKARPPVPDDFMDLGEADLLPRPPLGDVFAGQSDDDLLPPRRDDMLPPVQGGDTSQPLVLDSLDDYFDKLDEAFSTINTSFMSEAAAPRVDVRAPEPDLSGLETDLGAFDDLPAIEDLPADTHHAGQPATSGNDPFGGIEPMRADEAAVPTLDDLLAGMPSGPDMPQVSFDTTPAATLDEDLPALVEPRTPIDMPQSAPPVAVPMPMTVAPPSIEPPDMTATLSPALPQPLPAEAISGRSIIADAFSALLAAEEGEPGAAPIRLGGNGAQPIITDRMIDDVARRVVQRLALGTSDQMQAMVKEIVSGVAERLVREEIDRIRRNAPRS